MLCVQVMLKVMIPFFLWIVMKCLLSAREHEQKEKEKAARLHKEVLAAAKEKERLRKELEEKERKLVSGSHVSIT